MQLIKTYETTLKLNDELTFEGVINMFNSSIGIMYNAEGCGLRTGKYIDLRDVKKAIKRLAGV